MPDTLQAKPRQYDVCFFRDRRNAWHRLDRGVTLGSGSLSCVTDGETAEEPYGAVAAVHLESSGSKSDVESCRIAFADGHMLTVLNCNPGGYTDREQAGSYRAFVHDLHVELTAGGYRGIRFTEGWPLWRCQMMMAFAFFIALFCVGFGALMLYCFRDVVRGISLIVLGAYSARRLYRISLKNTPRGYTPDHLPEFLLS